MTQKQKKVRGVKFGPKPGAIFVKNPQKNIKSLINVTVLIEKDVFISYTLNNAT